MDGSGTPSQQYTLTTLKDRILAVGGHGRDRFDSTEAIYCYDVATNSWSAIGKMLGPRYDAQAAVLPSNKLVVVGGLVRPSFAHPSIDIGTVL